MEFCRNNKDTLKHFCKVLIKAITRGVMEFGAIVVAKEITKQVVICGVKGVVKAIAFNLVGTVADIVQVRLEYMGYKEAGKTVGAGGNVLAGALIGATVGGPVGAAVGALGGFAMWRVGEVTGNLIERFLGN